MITTQFWNTMNVGKPLLNQHPQAPPCRPLSTRSTVAVGHEPFWFTIHQPWLATKWPWETIESINHDLLAVLTHRRPQRSSSLLRPEMYVSLGRFLGARCEVHCLGCMRSTLLLGGSLVTMGSTDGCDGWSVDLSMVTGCLEDHPIY